MPAVVHEIEVSREERDGGDEAIRLESPQDAVVIATVTRAAFRDVPHSMHDEDAVVSALREAGALSLSLVAEVRGRVVGHLAASGVTITDGSTAWFGIGPVSVHPEHQGRGMGSRLVRAALSALRRRGASGCVLLGDPAFYGRFGFHVDPELLLPGAPASHFLVLAFASVRPKGTVAYHEAFTTGVP